MRTPLSSRISECNPKFNRKAPAAALSFRGSANFATARTGHEKSSTSSIANVPRMPLAQLGEVCVSNRKSLTDALWWDCKDGVALRRS